MRTELIDAKENYYEPVIQQFGAITYEGKKATIDVYIENGAVPIVQVIHNLYVDEELVLSKTISTKDKKQGVLTVEVELIPDAVIVSEIIARDRYNSLTDFYIDYDIYREGETDGSI